MEPLSPGVSMVWVFVGIMLSLVLPVVVQVVRKAAAQSGRLESPSSEEPPTLFQRVTEAWWRYASIGLPYLVLLGAAVVLAIALVFLLDLKFYHARDAALAGIAWESLVNKIFGQGGQPRPPQHPGASRA